MIRTGIYNLEQLKRYALKDFFGKEKNISIYLYQKIKQIDNLDEKKQYEELILNRFNSNRNIIKRTYQNRFNNFDNSAIHEISEQKYDRISVLDVAISDGQASCFFLEQGINNLQNFYYTGSDININYYLYKKYPNSKLYIIMDEKKHIIEITSPPFVWNFSRTEGSFYFINNWLKNHFFKKIQVALLNNEYKLYMKIELLHSDFKALMSNSTCCHIRNYNLFDKIPEKYTVIRAMNILHLGYFSNDQLSIFLNNIYNGLENSGLFIEGSNENAGTPVDGAIYKKSGNGFVFVREPENSSRIKELVLSFRYNN